MGNKNVNFRFKGGWPSWGDVQIIIIYFDLLKVFYFKFLSPRGHLFQLNLIYQRKMNCKGVG